MGIHKTAFWVVSSNSLQSSGISKRGICIMGASSSVKCEGQDSAGCFEAKNTHGKGCRWLSGECLPPEETKPWWHQLGRADMHLNPRADEVMETLLNNKWSKDESSNN